MTGDRRNSNMGRWFKFRLTSHRIGVILIIFSFIWGMYLIQVQINDRQSQSDYLKEKIITLSKEYIDAVAKEKGLTSMGDLVDNGERNGVKLPVCKLQKLNSYWFYILKLFCPLQ